MNDSYHARCLCGQMHFEVSGFGDKVANCHCSMCRKFHGAAFATLVAVTGLRWHSGLDRLREYTAPNGTIRSFCPDCGSSIGFRCGGQPQAAMEIAIALFDDEIPVRVDAHIYSRYKASWHSIDDRLPQFAEGRE